LRPANIFRPTLPAGGVMSTVATTPPLGFGGGKYFVSCCAGPRPHDARSATNKGSSAFDRFNVDSFK